MAHDELIGAQCVLCERVNTPSADPDSARYVLPFPIYCLINESGRLPTVAAFQVTMCSACYRRMHTWIIYTKRAYPTVDRGTIPQMFEQVSVEFQMAAIDNVPQAAAPHAVRLRRSSSQKPQGFCSECGAQPRPSPFASPLSEALLPELLRNPGEDSVLHSLPQFLRGAVLQAAYAAQPFESRLFPLVVESSPVLIELVDVLLCGRCYKAAVLKSRFPVLG